MNDPSLSEQIKNLQRKMSFYQTVLLIFAVVIALSIYLRPFPPVTAKTVEPQPTVKPAIKSPDAGETPSAPHYKEVMGILQPLSYSGIQALLRPEVTFSVDFTKRLWYIHNMHRFDENGHIILDEGRYGLCGELAAYVHNQIKPIFGDQYTIKFAKVAESGYFLSPQASHIILLIANKSPTADTVYLLDPTFQRYGKSDEFEEYLFMENSDNLAFADEKYSDVFFDIEQGTPIIINQEYLISLVVRQTGSKFNADNFTIAILATRRYKFSGRFVLALRKDEGANEIFEDKFLAKQIFQHSDYEALKNKLIEFYTALTSKTTAAQ